MTRSLRIFYIALFMLILTALGMWSMRSFFGFSTNPDATVLNGRWAKAVETHYDEEFNPIVNEELNLQGNYALVEGVRQKLKEQGVTLVMAILPAKARLYPEHLGEVKPSSIHANLYQDFHARVAADKILAPDLLGPLQQAKQSGQQVFLRTDTHWTPEGAQVAAENLAKAIAEKAPLNGEPQRFVTEPAEKITHKGDLRQFLPLDPLFENLMPAQEPLVKRNTREADNQPASDDALFADAQVPVALIGTSYSANPNWNFVGALKLSLIHI